MSSIIQASCVGGAGAALYMNECQSDVSIIVEDDACHCRFPAHSLMLSSISEVLNSMLLTEMSEKITRKIIIGDSNPTAVRQFLRYVYIGELRPSEWQEAFELLKVAHKYQVETLVNFCEAQLVNSITLARVCTMYEIGQLYSLSSLMSEAQVLILNSAFITIFTEGFENLSGKTLSTFLAHRMLNVETEVSLLYALKNWGKAECTRRGVRITKENVLGYIEPYLCHIRFSSIPPGQRKFIPALLTRNTNPTNILPRVKFFVPSLLHDHMASVKFVVELGSFINKKSSTEPLHCIKLSSDRNMYIMGFRIVGLFRSYQSQGTGKPMLTLYRDGGKRSVQFDLGSVPWKNGSYVGESVWREIVAYFPHPARIDKFSYYHLSVRFGNKMPIKWPKTRIEGSQVSTELNFVNIYTYGQCAGITELFVIPAPPVSNHCNNL